MAHCPTDSLPKHTDICSGASAQLFTVNTF